MFLSFNPNYKRDFFRMESVTKKGKSSMWLNWITVRKGAEIVIFSGLTLPLGGAFKEKKTKIALKAILEAPYVLW